MTEQATGRAAAYKRQLAERQRTQTTMVMVPSGFEWELRTPDLQGYVMTGRMPQSLVTQFLASAEKRGLVPAEARGEALKKFSEQPVSQEETMSSLIFMRELVREACVSPRIVVGGTGDDEIDPSEVDPGDFRFIVSWCLSHAGVTGLDGLSTFRGRRERRAAAAVAGRPKLRRKTVKAVEDK
jgi:hypothetical protein